MASPGIISNTRAVDVSIQAAAPESITGVSAANSDDMGMNKINNKRRDRRKTVFIYSVQVQWLIVVFPIRNFILNEYEIGSLLSGT